MPSLGHHLCNFINGVRASGGGHHESALVLANIEQVSAIGIHRVDDESQGIPGDSIELSGASPHELYGKASAICSDQDRSTATVQAPLGIGH